MLKSGMSIAIECVFIELDHKVKWEDCEGRKHFMLYNLHGFCDCKHRK